ncbi:MAG: prolipoprotein diacylglyceryl transferase [Gemmataceae bacterium]|nr:prolipoprotein diacylglyceryl transferase [Gemmataceae bacterium]
MNLAYGAIMTASLATGLAASRLFPSPLRLTARQKWGLALGAFCGGMIAAKLPFVLYDWTGFLSGAAWLDNGKTIMAGLVGGYFGVELAKRPLGITQKTGDGFAVPVALAVAVGRLGCIAAGCCYGLPTDLPWGMDLGDGTRRHPTQLYETAFHLAMAGLLAGLHGAKLLRGQLIKLYLISYFAYRFLTEYLRPEPVLALGLTAYQWAALAFIPLFAALWVHDAAQHSSPKRAGSPKLP